MAPTFFVLTPFLFYVLCHSQLPEFGIVHRRLIVYERNQKSRVLFLPLSKFLETTVRATACVFAKPCYRLVFLLQVGDLWLVWRPISRPRLRGIRAGFTRRSLPVRRIHGIDEKHQQEARDMNIRLLCFSFLLSNLLYVDHSCYQCDFLLILLCSG